MTASTSEAGGGADAGAAAPRESFKDIALRTLSAAGRAIAQLASGLNTAVLAALLLFWLALTAVTSVVGVGLLMAPAPLRALHALAGRERDRLARWGPEVVAPQPPPTRLRPALADPTTHRELRWLVRHSTLGLLLGLLGVLLPITAVRDSAFPLYWTFMPANTTATSLGIGNAHTWPDALAVALLGVGWIAIILGLAPGMARLQSGPGLHLLAAGPDVDLSLRVAELTATRAAALDAHATELRRIERSLHDGAQNRLVSVAVLLGAARRMWPVTRPAPTNSSNAPSPPPRWRWPNSARSRAASCRRYWPTGGSRARSPVSRRTARCRAGSTWTSPHAARPPSRRRPTSSSPKP